MRIWLIFLSVASLAAGAAEDLLRPAFEAPPPLARRIGIWIDRLDAPGQAEGAQENLVKIGGLAVPFLQNAFESSRNPAVKIRILQIFERLALLSCASSAVRCLGNEAEPVPVREQAAQTLGAFPSEENFGILAECARNRKAEPRLRRTAASVLCRQSSKKAVPHLIALLGHPDSATAARVYYRLCEIAERPNAPADSASWQIWWENNRGILEEE